jgi:hypothetical protein
MLLADLPIRIRKGQVKGRLFRPKSNQMIIIGHSERRAESRFLSR